MNVRVVLLAALLAGCGVALVTYKVMALGYELVPKATEDRWAVEMALRFQGIGDDARVRLHLPADRAPHQQVYDERILSEGMRVDVRTHGDGRVGVLSGRPGGRRVLSYRFAVHLRSFDRPLPSDEEALASPPDEDSVFLEPERAIQSDRQRVQSRLEEIVTPGSGPVTTVRYIYDYLRDEVVDVSLGDEADAMTVLQVERGGVLGKARLATALARAAGIPARVVAGFDLQDGSRSDVHYWAEVLLAGQWYALDPASGHLGHLPRQRLTLYIGDGPLFTTSGVEDVAFQLTALKEEISQHRLYERRVRRSDQLLDRVSLYSLPVRTQMTLRVLLLIPFGALIVSIFRNMVGVPTFGTFMPVLLGLAFLETTLPLGVGLLLLIIGVGWVFRALLDRLQLLMIPRLSFLLTVVIGIIVAISLLSEQAGMTAGLYAAVFPIVIITATIERFSIMIVEEGTRNAFKTTLGTLVVATACYGVLMSDVLQRTVLAFPELLLPVLGCLLLIGRYTGYRLSEWARFSAFKDGTEAS
jgi:hypothetical protein